MSYGMKTDREICAAATAGPWEVWEVWESGDSQGHGFDGYIWFGNGSSLGYDPKDSDIDRGMNPALHFKTSDAEFIANFNPQKVAQMLDRQEQLEAKLKEASKFIQKLGPTIDYDIVAEIEEMLSE